MSRTSPMKKFTQYENVKKRLKKGMKVQPKDRKEERSVRFSNYNPESNDSKV